MTDDRDIIPGSALDIIMKATANMDGAEYRDYMELPLKRRLAIAKTILKDIAEQKNVSG